MWDITRADGRQWLVHNVPPWIDPDSTNFFITVCCQTRGSNQLCLRGVGEAILSAGRFYHKQHKWLLTLLLVMPDHIHMIVSFAQRSEMAKVVSAWKRYLARQHGIIWQKNFFDHRLRSELSARSKADYILQNPVRAGLVATMGEWPLVFMPD